MTTEEKLLDLIKKPEPYRTNYIRNIVRELAADIDAAGENIDVKELVRSVMHQTEDDRVEGRKSKDCSVELPMPMVHAMLKLFLRLLTEK